MSVIQYRKSRIKARISKLRIISTDRHSSEPVNKAFRRITHTQTVLERRTAEPKKKRNIKTTRLSTESLRFC